MSLVKLTVLSFNNAGGPDLLIKPPMLYSAMFNPNSYKIEYKINYQAQQSIGNVPSNAEGEAPVPGVPAPPKAPTGLSATKSDTTPKNSTGGPAGEEPRTISFDFLIDGTGASGTKRNVYLDVELFKKTVGYQKDLNPTADDKKNLLPFLLLIWGTFIFQCKIESISVNFTLFDTFGIPLRATMSCTFREFPGVLGNMSNPLESAFNSKQFASAASVADLMAGVANLAQGVVAKAKDMDLNSLRQPL